MERLKLSKALNRQSVIVILVNGKLYVNINFYMLIARKQLKVVGNLLFKKVFGEKRLLKRHVLYVHIGFPSKRQFQYVPATLVIENKENYFEVYTCQIA